MRSPRLINIALLAGVAICLLYIWLPDYFLTGDGPCHVANAQVLHDFWAGRNVALNSRFFEVMYQPNPNWMATLVMALLLFIVKGVIAEKLFITLYIFLLVGGSYLLLKKLSGGKNWWLLSVFIFVFTHVLSKGFYNFSFSIAFYCWAVWSWLRFADDRSVRNALLFVLFAAVTFFTHLLAFVFAAGTCGALAISYALASQGDSHARWRYFLRLAGLLLLLVAPFLFLMRWFTEKEGGLGIAIGHHFGRLVELAQFKFGVFVKSGEVPLAAVAGCTLLGLGVCSLVRFRAVRKVHKYDGFILALLVITFVYVTFPEDFLGRLILITMRVQLFVLILVACCISYMLPWQKVKNTGGLVLFGCFVVMSLIRIPSLVKAGEGVSDISSVVPSIRQGAVVLPLNLAPGGKDKHGSGIADRAWLFSHVCQYLNTMKPMIVLDNYEANMGYFPLRWNQWVNPYLSIVSAMDVGEAPPFGDIDRYTQKTGVQIDYVIMWCFDSSLASNPGFRKLYEDISMKYKRIYSSPSGRTLLYEKLP